MKKNMNKGFRFVSTIVFSCFIIYVYWLTVISRHQRGLRKYDFHPFWTYEAILDGKDEFIMEAILNIVLFIPVGFLLGGSFISMTWWRIMVVGSILSIAIEALQFLMMRGFSEIDDVIHNTLGCMIGYGLYLMVYSTYSRIKQNG